MLAMLAYSGWGGGGGTAAPHATDIRYYRPGEERYTRQMGRTKLTNPIGVPVISGQTHPVAMCASGRVGR